MLYKSAAGRYRPVRVADGPIMARCRFIKNASWVFVFQIRIPTRDCFVLKNDLMAIDTWLNTFVTVALYRADNVNLSL